MKTLYFCALAALTLSACSGNNTARQDSAVVENDSDEIVVAEMPAIMGQWRIESIVENDSLKINPASIESDGPQYFMFDQDGTFGVVTNCNTINGSYSLSGDKISFSGLLSTAMACHDMSVEESLQRILPNVRSLSWTNDSTLRLATDNASQYVTLKLMEATPAE